MANPEHLAKLKEGVEAWNQWRKDHPDVEPELRQAHLFQAFLQEVNLSKADLSYADLNGADLDRASLCGAKRSGAILRWVDLYEADLRGADLSYATLVNTILEEPTSQVVRSMESQSGHSVGRSNAIESCDHATWRINDPS